MLGLRAQYALSSVLVAHLRRNMHFAYLQDDWRATQQADAEPRPALRVLDAVLGARQRPVELRSGDQHDRQGEGRLARRPRADQSRSQQLRSAPRLRLHGDAASTVVRGGYGISYVHFSRAGGGDLLPINGPQVVNAVVNQTNPTSPSFVPAEQGYPAGLADPSQFNPLTANITYMPRDFHSSPVQSWYISVQRELARNMLLDVAYVGNRADDLLLFANYNQAAPNNAAGTIALQIARPIPSFADITYAFNGGKSRYKALQTKFEWRMSRDVTLLSSLTLSQTKDNGVAVARERERQLPGAAGLPQPRRRLRPVGLPPAVQQHDQLRVVAAVRQRPALGVDASPLIDALIGGWQLAGINRVNAGEPVTLHLHAGRDVRRLRHRAGLPRRQQLPRRT